MHSPVSFKVRFITKALATAGAFIRFLSSVASPVCLKAVLVVKTLAAACAVKGFLSGFHVSFLVSNKVCGPVKTLSTLRAFIWFFTSVDSLMSKKAGFVTKAFAADGTFVGLLPCVDSLVHFKAGLTSEALSANLALVLSLAFVYFLLFWHSTEVTTLAIGGLISPLLGLVSTISLLSSFTLHLFVLCFL